MDRRTGVPQPAQRAQISMAPVGEPEENGLTVRLIEHGQVDSLDAQADVGEAATHTWSGKATVRSFSPGWGSADRDGGWCGVALATLGPPVQPHVAHHALYPPTVDDCGGSINWRKLLGHYKTQSEEQGLSISVLIRDRDRNFTKAFDGVLAAEVPRRPYPLIPLVAMLWMNHFWNIRKTINTGTVIIEA